MADNKTIKTTKIIYPQIYAYTLPENQGTAGYALILKKWTIFIQSVK